jgi:hypothetical protein
VKREATASPQAKSTAAVVLEGLTGLRSAPDAARTLGVTVARYYALEAHAVAGLLTACEPAAPGPSPGLTTERDLARLRQDHRRQDQELTRLRAVLRATQRSLGVQPVASSPSAAATRASAGKGAGTGAGKRRRPRRPVVRALTVVRRLMAANGSPPAGSNPALFETAAAESAGTVSTPPPTVTIPSRGPDGG